MQVDYTRDPGAEGDGSSITPERHQESMGEGRHRPAHAEG